MKIHISVEGEPVAKARPRMNRRTGNVYTPKKTAMFEALIRDSALRAMKGKKMLTGAVKIAVTAFFSVAGSWSRVKKANALTGRLRHTKRPDLSNVIKSVEDAMNGVVYKDDSQIVMLWGGKGYSLMPRIEIDVEEVE